jgi:hypothetical protein
VNTLSALSILPSNFELLIIAVLFVMGGLVLYALYKKGDVRAVVSHGQTVFTLEAKEQRARIVELQKRDAPKVPEAPRPKELPPEVL